MQPAPFDYEALTDLRSVVGLLADSDREAKVVAGGQSLLRLLNLGLARHDPAAELPTLAVALDATMVVFEWDGSRRSPAADLFVSVFTTSFRPARCSPQWCSRHCLPRSAGRSPRRPGATAMS